MSGSRLARGRLGRVLFYGFLVLLIMFLVFVYRTSQLEIDKLEEVNAQCIHQQEALAAQLQVLYDYKIRLEKSLSDEKSSNEAVKQELQQRASRERNLKDKEVESNQRQNALQQSFRLLQAEHKDLKEDCIKKQLVAIEDSKRLDKTLRDLRIELKKVSDEKDILKTKNMELEVERKRIEDKYNKIIENSDNVNSTLEHLHKENMQLHRALDESKKSSHFMVGGVSVPISLVSPRVAKKDLEKPPIDAANPMQVARPSHLKVSSPSEGARHPQPLQSPQNYPTNNHVNNIEDKFAQQQQQNDNLDDNNLFNEQTNNVRFGSRDGNIVPVGPNERTQSPNSHAGLKDVNNNEENNENLNNDNVQEEADKRALPIPPWIRSKDQQTASSSSKEPMVLPLLRPQSGVAQSPDQFDSKGKSTKLGLASTSPSLSSPQDQAVAIAPVKSAPKIRLPAGVVPIPQLVESAADNEVGESAKAQTGAEQVPLPPNHRPVDSLRDGLPIKILRGAAAVYKMGQGGQEVGDNEHMDKILDFGNGNDNNDDNLDEHYDEVYKGRLRKVGNNHGDPDQDDEYQLDYDRNNFKVAQNE